MNLVIANSPKARREIITNIVHSFFSDYKGSSDDIFETIEEHIQTHGYFLQNEHEVDISEDEIFTSWHEYVLDPILTLLASTIPNTNLIDPLEEYVIFSKMWFSHSKARSFYGFEQLQLAFEQYKQVRKRR